ncbi:MAG: miniconductance mechanosensitive channel, partial [Pseudoalteromonas distincta]
MDINLRGWLTVNLGISDTVSALILVLMTVLVVFIVWGLSKKILHYIIPKLTAKTKSLWDNIIFNDRIINSFATLIPAIILDQSLPVLLKNSSLSLSFILGLTGIIVVLVSVWILVSLFNSINEILSQKEQYRDKPIGSLTQLAKILVFSVGAILIISTVIGKSPIYLLSGLGAIAAILLLVFKDSILGFVAS